jgi:hypothetical protein
VPEVAHEDERWPGWARDELHSLQELEGKLLPASLRGGFCALRPKETVLAATHSLAQQLQSASLCGECGGDGGEDVQCRELGARQ